MSTPPFSPAEARAARLRMGMTREQVATEMTQLGVWLRPQRVKAWELGTRVPSETELFALADVLWCPTPVLMSLRPRTLGHHRLPRQLTRERLAHRIGMEIHAYARAETERRRHGEERQTRALAWALGTTPEHLRETIGRIAEVIRLLAQAVESRWKSRLAPLAELAEVDKRRVQYALGVLRQEYTRITERYMGHVVAGSAEARLREIADERARWLTRLPEHFWELVGHADVAALPVLSGRGSASR
ncbi:helix-turn-helix domain-containing protein [Streptomyces sp. NPDC048603]|uniref:helix-turn-helix domain-containing protein n=1 Tax=Streptomyces sp. NPDC048603 TaxID=3365577 RepID=UPI0037201CF3